MQGMVLRCGVVIVGVTIALLAGCGGTQPPTGAPGAMPQSRAIVAHADRSGSWMLPEAKDDDLLYVSDYSNRIVSVFSYPAGTLVGTLTGFEDPYGLCSDKEGDVFVVDQVAMDIYEYAHGGSSPIATLNDSSNYPLGCAVDPTTGNLAAVGGYHTAVVSVFPDALGSPTVYSLNTSVALNFCAYDNHGDLFAGLGDFDASAGLLELPEGGKSLAEVSISGGNLSGGGALQWVGKYLVIGDPHGPGKGTHGPTTVAQLKVSGSTATIASTIQLSDGKLDRNPGWYVQFAVNGDTIINPLVPGRNVGLWHYPGGGRFYKKIKVVDPYGVAVSIAPQ